MLKLKHKLMLLSICLVSSLAQAGTSFKLHPGDLLFQDLNCGELCNGIDAVTYGYQHSYISHMAMVVSTTPSAMVIEAITPGVVMTPVAEFLRRSLDSQQRPRVIVGRITAAYQHLIPGAIRQAQLQLGKPYNASFIPAAAQAFYCSELIEYAFKQANQQQAVFKRQPMNFAAPNTQQITPGWQKYYAQLQIAVPQGSLGSNPGEISRESSLQIVHVYGQLRHP